MTTTVLKGINWTDGNNGANIVAISAASLKIISTDAYQMSYTYAAADFGGTRDVFINEPVGQSYAIFLNGVYFDGQNSEISVGEVSWGNGKKSQIIVLDPTPDDNASFIFQLGGDALPVMTTLAQANALYTSVTAVTGTFGGTFGPTKAFTLQSLTSHLVTSQNDTLIAKAGFDNWTGQRINTGIGNDYVAGLSYNEYLILGSGADTGSGGSGNDTIFGNAGNDSLLGGLGNDTVFGGGDNDRLYGDAGIDYLNGGLGNDILSGGLGNDALRGHLGTDIFVFTNGGGADRVVDFQNNTDTLWLGCNLGLTTLSSALAKATQVGLNVVFNFGDGDTFTILNTTKVQLIDDITIL